MAYVGSYLWKLRQAIGHELALMPGAMVVLRHEDGQVLFTQRGDDGTWCLPAGAAEIGGSFARTALAELSEEAGVEVREEDLVPFGCLSEAELHTLDYPSGDVTIASRCASWWSAGAETRNPTARSPRRSVSRRPRPRRSRCTSRAPTRWECSPPTSSPAASRSADAVVMAEKRIPTPASVRRMNPQELDAAVAVWREANIARHAPHGPERTARIRAKLSAPDALPFVALRPGIVGMALAEPGRFGDGQGELDPSLLHISMVFVRPTAQRTGVGLPLVRHVLDVARSLRFDRVAVWTAEENMSARKLYERVGLTLTGRRAHVPSGTHLQYGCLLGDE